MRSSTNNLILSVIAITVGFALVFVLSGYINTVKPPLPEGYEDQDLSLQGAKLKNYSLGFNGLIADWYWMQSLQYLGGKILNNQDSAVTIENLRPLNPRLLYPMLDNATELDPHFSAAYSFGAVVLPAIDPEQAIAFTEKGIRNNPNEWRLYQHLGFIYWRLGNYEKAADAYQRGSEIAGAPPFFKMMVASMKKEGGSRDTARAIYRQLLEQAEDDQTKKVATLRLQEFDSLDERDAMNKVLAEYKEKHGRCIGGMAELVPLLRPVKLPNGLDFHIDRSNALVDPTGVPYVLNVETCTVEQNPKSEIPTI